MTDAESDRWFSENTSNWSSYGPNPLRIPKRDDLKQYKYEYRERPICKWEGNRSVWCTSDQVFTEFLNACNSKRSWGDYRDNNLREENGQLLMF